MDRNAYADAVDRPSLAVSLWEGKKSVNILPYYVVQENRRDALALLLCFGAESTAIDRRRIVCRRDPVEDSSGLEKKWRPDSLDDCRGAEVKRPVKRGEEGRLA